MKHWYCVPKRALLLIAGIVWLAAGFNVARLGVLAYMNIQPEWYLYLLTAAELVCVRRAFSPRYSWRFSIRNLAALWHWREFCSV